MIVGIDNDLIATESLIDVLDLDESDIKVQELQSLQAIFPEATFCLDDFSGSIDIKISLLEEVEIIYVDSATNQRFFDSVTYLPPIHFEFKLVSQYPETAPEISLSSSFLSDETLGTLKKDLLHIWVDCHDIVIYSMIDYLQEQANALFDMGSPIKATSFESFKVFQILNKKTLEEKFNSKTFTCQICIGDHKGESCTRLTQCGHTFCNQCLEDYFSSCIISGDVEKIHCPDFECTKRITELENSYSKLDCAMSNRQFNEFKDSFLRPPISLGVLKRVVSIELLERYETLFHRKKNDILRKLFPARVVQCAREVCENDIFRDNTDEDLVICRKCEFAFCFLCRQSWHGTYRKCAQVHYKIPTEALKEWLSSVPKSNDRIRLGHIYGKAAINKIADEFLMDQLFEKAVQDSSQGLVKCPSCGIVIQRLDGCNKMRCKRCLSHFCNLCGMQLDMCNPYDHFKDPNSSCFERLFDGMPGIEDP